MYFMLESMKRSETDGLWRSLITKKQNETRGLRFLLGTNSLSSP